MKDRAGQLFFGAPAVTAGFDADGDWHDGGTGRYAKKGWSSAKAAILKLVRGAAAADLVARDGKADLTFHPSVPRDVARRLAPNGRVTARYHDRTHAVVDVGGKPTLVRWDRFAEPETPVIQHMAGDTDPTAPEYAKGRWNPGERTHFEYHCLESEESCDIELFRRTHQIATVLHETEDYDSLDKMEGSPTSWADRAEAAMPRMYRLRFDDGLEYDAVEDELYTDPAGWDRPDYESIADRIGRFAGDPDEKDSIRQTVETMFTMDLGDGVTTQAEVSLTQDTRDYGPAAIVRGQFVYQGDEIGEFQRVLHLNPETREPTVYHETISIDPEFRGRGYGAKFVARTVDRYRDNGFIRVDTHGSSSTNSAYTDGAYVWAKAGFDWDLRTYNDRRVFLRSAKLVAKRLEDNTANPPDGQPPEITAHAKQVAERLQSLIIHVDRNHPLVPPNAITPEEVAAVGNKEFPVSKNAMTAGTAMGVPRLIDFMYTKNIVEDRDAFKLRPRPETPTVQDMRVWSRSPEEWANDMGYNPKLIGTLETIRGGPKPFGYIESRAQNSGARGGADADIQDELYNLFADGAAAVANDRVMIRVPVEILDSIEEAGRFKSQHETGTSRGMLSPLDRERFETDVFGIKPKSPAKKAPVYGLVASDNVGTIGHSQYGDVGFLLKGDRIADRTTLSAGDSLFEAVPIPVPSVEWSGAGDDTLAAAHAAAIGFVGDAMIRDRLENRQFSTVAFEAQVHGGVTLDDVAGIVVFGPDAEPKARALADKLGVPLHVAPDSDEAMRQLRPGVDEDSLTRDSRTTYGRTTYGDILPEKPVTQDMVVAPDRTLGSYITPGVERWAEKLAGEHPWTDEGLSPQAQQTAITEALAEWKGGEKDGTADWLWDRLIGQAHSRTWIDQTLSSPTPDPDAVETLQQAHLAAVHELGDNPHPFYRHAQKKFDPFAQGAHGQRNKRTATSSWWRADAPFDPDLQAKFGDFRHDANFDASQVLANIGMLHDNGEYLIVDNPETIDRLMAGEFPIAPEAPVIQNMPDRLDEVFADPVVNRIIDRYTEAGHPVYVVGGAIRSVLNNEPINDVDLTTSATPEESTRILGGVGTVYPLGEKFGTVVVNVDGMDYEVTTHRTEVYDPVSRKPEVVFTDSLPEDLARRDFTFNAMAVGPDRQLVDPYNGQQDLTDKVVKAVGDPDERFTEDPLRIVRAVRFASTLGFTIEPETLAAAKRQADRLDIVSTERFKTELDKILKSVRPDAVTNAVGWANSIGITGRMFGPLEQAAKRVGVENRTRFIGVPAKYRFAALVTDASLNDGVNPLDLVGDLKRGSAEMRNIKQVVDVIANIAETRFENPTETKIVVLRAVRNLNDTQLDMLKAVLPYQLGGEWDTGTTILDQAFDWRRKYRAPLPVDGNDLAGLGLKGREIGTAVRTLTDELLRRDGRLPKHVALRLADPNRKRFATENMSLARRPGEGIVEPILRERGKARLVLSTNRLKRSMGVGVGDTLEARYDAPNSGYVIVDRPMPDGSTRAVRVSLDNFEEEVRVESLADEALRYDTPDGFADAMGAVDHPTAADRELYDELRDFLITNNMLSYPSPDSVNDHTILTDRKLREAARLTGIPDTDVNWIINQRNVLWHSTPTGDVYAGAGYGLHVGTWQAALEAARFPGAPPDGKEFWDGTDRYDGPVNTSTGAITGEFYPNLFPLRIVGPMLNRRYDPVSDDYANSRMTAQTTKGQAKTGYYYLNHAEDPGSISAVLPDGDHIVRLHTSAELTDVWNKAHGNPVPSQIEAGILDNGGTLTAVPDAPVVQDLVATRADPQAGERNRERLLKSMRNDFGADRDAPENVARKKQVAARLGEVVTYDQAYAYVMDPENVAARGFDRLTAGHIAAIGLLSDIDDLRNAQEYNVTPSKIVGLSLVRSTDPDGTPVTSLRPTINIPTDGLTLWVTAATLYSPHVSFFYAGPGVAVPDFLAENGGPEGSPGWEKAIRETAAGSIVSYWASSSSSTVSLVAQDAVINQRGLDPSGRDALHARLMNSTVERVAAYPHKDIVEAVTEAMFQNTQTDMEARGIDTVTVYRGMWDIDRTVAPSTTTPATAVLAANPLSSWTVDPWMAFSFANGVTPNDTTTQVVIKKTVPASHVFATPYTGIGAGHESEVVVIGHGSDTVAAIDVWTDNNRAAMDALIGLDAPDAPTTQDIVDTPKTATVGGREVPVVDAPTIKEIVEAMGANDLKPEKLRARYPERYAQNAVGEWKLADGERAPELWRGTIERGRAVDRFVPVRLIDRNRGLFSNTPDGEPYPPTHLWRAISEQEWELIQQTGVIKSDGRMNLGAPGTPDDEGTVAAVGDPSWYLPGALSSEQDGNPRTGRIIRIEFRDEDGWRTDTVDEYQKTLQPVPASRIDMVSAPMTRVDGIYVSHPARPEEPVTQDMAVRPLPYTVGVPANPADRARVVRRNRTLIATRYSEVTDAEDPPSLEDFTADVVAGLDSLRADGDPVVRVPWVGARGIAEGGRFKSQHETGVSTVNYNPSGRVNIEHSSLGVPVDIDPTLRPIFGVIESTYEEGAHGADMYGPVTFILKRSVLDKATMSFGDSGDLDVIPVRATGDVTDDELLAAASDRAINDIADSAVAEHLADDMWEGPDMNESGMYRELQFHGGLTLDDVEDVTYEPDDVDEPDAVAAIAALQTAGLTPVTQWMAERPDDRVPGYFKQLGDLPIPEHIRQVGSETQDSPDETKRSRYAGMIQSLPEVRVAAATTRRDSIEVAVPHLAVTRIIQDGRLKSQHETNRSHGKLDPELRRRTESEMFGIPADHPAETMPIYGFVSEAATFPRSYGNVFLRMKPEVADRTTVTFGDSLLTHPTSMIQPVPVDRLPEASEYELVRATPPREFSRSDDYVEAQIHGGVRLDEDVAAVVMRHDAFWDSVLAAFVMADYLNLPVTVTDKVSMVMFHREVAGLRSMYPELNNVELAYEVPRIFRAKPGMLREDMSALELLGATYTLDDIRRLLKDGSLTEQQREDLNYILETRETMQ